MAGRKPSPKTMIPWKMALRLKGNDPIGDTPFFSKKTHNNINSWDIINSWDFITS